MTICQTLKALRAMLEKEVYEVSQAVDGVVGIRLKNLLDHPACPFANPIGDDPVLNGH
ncbi:MAG: hypothetical protein HWN68_17000 [Desulfobacterales bacterium]|nr:hypothetical protein [Desulfobacterales bacterium]